MTPFKTEAEAQKRIEEIKATDDNLEFIVFKIVPHSNLQGKGFRIEEHDMSFGFMRCIGA